ncbi:hypothetical protein GHT06_009686 [Daphnia sinensis]|uniref:Uncharacterized protein n=1 Tax=Daphnia sinensis TaxID=1820382 RepID=A0AAD5Q1Q6_9CRUS|nr:hypothetical protein GHT06_009686 [Daphnia sinensis]
MSWLVPEVRVGDISLPMIRQCDSVDDASASEGHPSFSCSRDCADDEDNTMETNSVQDEPAREEGQQRSQQLTWCVMSDDDDNNEDGRNENRGNLPREGALQLMMIGAGSSGSSNAVTPATTTGGGFGSSLLAVPWQVPRRRHSWICRTCAYQHIIFSLHLVQ